MTMKQLSKAIGMAALTASGVVLADAPKLSEVLDASGISITGYVDAAYTYYSVDPDDQPGNILNYFDDSESSFGVKQAGLTISSLPDVGFGALVNVTAGSDADWIHSNGGTDSGGFDLTQAYVQYATGPDNVLGDGFAVIAGKFNTLAGAEVIAPTGNTNISRSIAFLYALPFTHTGVRLSYAPSDTFTLYAGLNNGWDQQDDYNSDKTGELGIIWSPASAFTWAASVYSGKEPLDPTDPDSHNTTRSLFDTVLTFKATDALTFVLNYDIGTQEDAILDDDGDLDDAEWSAIVGYVNYQISKEWRVSLRGEQFDDKDGYRIGLLDFNEDSSSFLDVSEKTTAATLTVGYAPVDNFEVRAEVRMDSTEEDAIIDDDDADDSQTYFALEGLYKF